MRMIDWMRSENLDDQQVAKLLGNCSASAVKKWKYGERVPDAKRILQIESLSKGGISLTDWVKPAEPERAAS